MIVALMWTGITAQVGENRSAESCDPALARLFAPAHPRLGRYQVCVTSAALETLVDADWSIEGASPLDAFGSAGAYDRSRLLRLYAGHRARVAHGWRQTGGEFESLTLVSPYPDVTLMHLAPGTLIIRHILCCM